MREKNNHGDKKGKNIEGKGQNGEEKRARVDRVKAKNGAGQH